MLRGDGDLDATGAKALQTLRQRASHVAETATAELAPRHHLARRARALHKTVLSAALRRRRPGDAVFSFLLSCYVANDLDDVAALECVAARCDRPGDCAQGHHPLHELSGVVFQTAIAAVNALHPGPARSNAERAAKRYLHHIKLAFPRSLSDIQRLEATLAPDAGRADGPKAPDPRAPRCRPCK